MLPTVFVLQKDRHQTQWPEMSGVRQQFSSSELNLTQIQIKSESNLTQHVKMKAYLDVQKRWS